MFLFASSPLGSRHTEALGKRRKTDAHQQNPGPVVADGVRRLSHARHQLRYDSAAVEGFILCDASKC